MEPGASPEIEEKELEDQKGEGRDRYAKAVYAMLRRSKNHKKRQEWEKEVRRNRRFARSKQWTQEQKAELEKQGMIPVVINETLQNVRHLCSFVTSSSPGFLVIPIGSGIDPLLADVDRAILEKVGNDNFIEDIAGDVAWDAKVDGIGWFVLDIDETKRPSASIAIRREDALKIHMDPNSKDKYYRDAKFIIYEETISRAEAKRVWGLKDGEMGPPPDFADVSHSTEIEDGDYEEQDPDRSSVETLTGKKPVYSLEAWIRRERKQLNIVDHMSGDVEPWSGDVTTAKKYVQDLKMQNPEGSYGVATTKAIDAIRIRVVGSKTKSVDINPIGHDFWGNPIIPLIPVPNIRIEGPYHYADVSLLVGPQMERNKRRSQLIYYAAVSSNAPWIFPKGSIDPQWMHEHGSKPGAQIEYDLNKAKNQKPERCQPTRLPEALVTLEESSREMLRYLIGLNEAVMGIPPTREASGKMVLALQEYATAGMKPFIKQLEISMSLMGRALLGMVGRFWRVPDIVRVKLNPQWDFELQIMPHYEAAKMGDEMALMELYELQRQRMEQEMEAQNLAKLIYDPTVGEFDVKVSAGSTMPANRMARLDYALEMYDRGIYDELAVLEFDDNPVKYDVIKRKKQIWKEAQIRFAMEQLAAEAEQGVPVE